jgi:hypothetical protein
MGEKKSLGLVELPERTIEHDFTILERFQDFSAELLRLALLGVSAIAFGVSKLIFPGGDKSVVEIDSWTKRLVGLALVSFCTSAAAALIHRYASSNSMSWHLQAMRRYENNIPEQVRKADSEASVRFKFFKISSASLSVSAIFLAIGAALLSLSLWRLL